MKTLTEHEVREVERFHGVRLPQAFVVFLRGEDGILERLVWEDPGAADADLVFDCESLKRLRRAAEGMLMDEQIPFTLAPNDFVFHFRSGPRFLFFRCNPDNDDPPVFCCSLDAAVPQQVCERFSEWAARLLVKPDTRAVSSSREPPGVSAHLNLGALVTPEMEAELRRVSERFHPELAEVESKLGWLLGAFRTATASLVAGVVLGVMLLGLGLAILGWLLWQTVGAGFALPLAASEEMSWLGVGVVGGLSGGLGVVGGLLIARARRLSRSCLVVAAHGFSWVRVAQVEMVAWSEIEAFRETAEGEPFPLLNFLTWMLPKRKGIHYEAFTTDGRRFSFSANTVQQVGRLRAIFRQVATELAIPWSSFGTGAG